MPKTTILTVRLESTCLNCGRKTENGIWVGQSFLCETCEKDIVQLGVDDPLYETYVKQIKSISTFLFKN